MPLSEMEDSPFQRNKHSSEQIKALAKIMKIEGVVNVIFITAGTNRICFGHGRRDAALLNKWTEFPIIYVTFQDEDQEFRMVQSENAISRWSELDLSQIHLDLEQFGPFDIDLLGIKNFGFEPPEKEVTLKEPTDEPQFICAIYLKSETELQSIYEEMRDRNLQCKIIT